MMDFPPLPFTPPTPLQVRRLAVLTDAIRAAGHTGSVVFRPSPLAVLLDPPHAPAQAVIDAHDWTEPAAGETLTANNTLVGVTITPGMPVRIQTTGTGGTVDVRRSRALGDAATVRRHIGLAAQAIAPAASGNVLVVGPLELTTAEWDAVTGEAGGLVRGVEYYLDDLFGRLTRTPQPAAASVSVTNADGSYTGPRAVVSVGVSLTPTVMLVRPNWRGDEVAWHEGQADPHPQYAPAGHTHPGGGGAAAVRAATVTVPGGRGRIEWSEAVADASVSATSRVNVWLAPSLDADENCPEMTDLQAIWAEPGTGTVTFGMTFTAPTAGPIKLHYTVGAP